MLDRNYSPDLKVRQIFDCVYGLLMTPEPEDPLDSTIASQYLQDLEGYKKAAKAHTEKHAKVGLENTLKDLLSGSDE